jgi:hypothetical protein
MAQQAPDVRPGKVLGRPWVLGLIGVVGIFVATGATAAVAFMSSGSSSAASGAAYGTNGVSKHGLPALQTGNAPWGPDVKRLPERLDPIGVPFSNMEGTALHIHPHLSILVNGRSITVPTGIGISYADQAMAALHTHDTAGTIHVESPEVRDYTLGQFFDVWGVGLTKKCLGGYCTTTEKRLRAFVDGEPAAKAPAIKLVDGQQIVLAYGTPEQIARALS